MREKTKYLKRAAKLALKSGCLRAKRGAVLVRQGQVLAQGFNRVYPTNDYSQKHGCLRDKLGLFMGREPEKCRGIHAEAAAIAQAAKKGIALAGATAYLTAAPCLNCAKLLLAAGIKKVYYLDNYSYRAGIIFLEKMGVPCQRVKLANDDPKERLRDATHQE